MEYPASLLGPEGCCADLPASWAIGFLDLPVRGWSWEPGLRLGEVLSATAPPPWLVFSGELSLGRPCKLDDTGPRLEVLV